MAGEFSNQVVLITGASGNLGQAVTKRFADGGAKLVLIDHNEKRLPELQAQYPESLPLAVDVTNAEAVDAMVRQAEEKFGQIHVLAHTVGGFAAGYPVHETPQDLWDRMYNLNVRPVYLVGGRVAQHMLEQAIGGKIIFVLARSGLSGGARSAAYTASKAAAQRIMQSMAAELKERGINVNGVMPSTIDTPPNRESMPNADFSKWVTPEELADAIAFLASEAGNGLYGASLEVYGRA
ncbi:MAG: SDR family NAD(P)-dependent oxidoreductase [Anaerolineae bacterium]|nr:SDR family NAD(P)-dependent oxidoreductase [Anaerolineae bacterium]